MIERIKIIGIIKVLSLPPINLVPLNFNYVHYIPDKLDNYFYVISV